MKKYIQLDNETITLEPKNQEELADLYGILVSLVASLISSSTESIKDDAKRVEVILKACGSFGGAAAKLIITEEALAKSVPEEKGSSNDA